MEDSEGWPEVSQDDIKTFSKRGRGANTWGYLHVYEMFNL